MRGVRRITLREANAQRPERPQHRFHLGMTDAEYYLSLPRKRESRVEGGRDIVKYIRKRSYTLIAA